MMFVNFSLKESDSSIGFVDYPRRVLHNALELYESCEIVLDEFNKCLGSAIRTYRNAMELVQGYDPTRGKDVATVNNLNHVAWENHMTFINLFR